MTNITADVLERIVHLAARSLLDDPDGRRHAIIPTGYKIESILPVDWNPPLLRTTAAPAMHDLDSFIAYCKRYQTPATRFFAEPGFISGGRPTVTCIIDYHEADKAQHGAHVVTYAPRYSEQWKRWTAICANAIKQAEFAEFVEENRGDIAEPAAAQMLDIISTFKASKKTDFDSLVYQRNGDVMLAYSEKTEEKGSVKMPEKLMLGIPVYFRSDRYAVPVLIRYRVGNGGVVFQLKVDRADVIEDEAFSVLTKKITEATGIEVYLGRKG